MRLSHAMGMGLLALAPMTGFAAGIGNNVDAYYVSSGVDVGYDDDGDGLGIRGQFAFADQLFFSGEYQTVNYDDSDIDLDQIRLGVGLNSDARQQLVFFGLAEFIHLDYDFDDDNGIGLHGGAIYKVTKEFSVNGRVGYVDVGDFDGIEWLVGASYQFTPMIGAFVDYRATYLENGGADFDVDDLRVGVRFRF